LSVKQTLKGKRSPSVATLREYVNACGKRQALGSEGNVEAICFRWDGGNAYDVEIVDYH